MGILVLVKQVGSLPIAGRKDVLEEPVLAENGPVPWVLAILRHGAP
jgi:hypothetical protein